jgi:transposase-like protein
MSLARIYIDEIAARKHLERLLWPEGPMCPHCGNIDPSRIHKLQGKSTRPGVYKCRECEKPFTVTVGTVFADSKVPLHKWVYATHLLTSSKKGISAHQLHRMLGVTYKTAWFMAHRIREAMRKPKDADKICNKKKDDQSGVGDQEGGVSEGERHNSESDYRRRSDSRGTFTAASPTRRASCWWRR